MVTHVRAKYSASNQAAVTAEGGSVVYGKVGQFEAKFSSLSGIESYRTGICGVYVDAGAELTRCAGFDLTRVRPMNVLVSR